MTGHRLVIVGASLAGVRAAEAARAEGFTGAITLIGAESAAPYDRPPLSKAFLESPTASAPPALRSEATLRDDLGVDLRLGRAATGLDTWDKRIRLGEEEVRYDTLIIATGARPRALPGVGGLDGAHVLRTLDDARAVRAALDRGARTVVIGAGFIGSEVASGARARGLTVTVVEAQPTPLVRAIGHELGQRLAELHRANGTDLRCGTGVRSIIGYNSVDEVHLEDGSILPADLVVVGIGADPAVDWLAGSGLTLDDGIVCDATLWTGVDGVYAAGDVVNWHNPRFDRRMRLEHWTSATEQAARAVRNALDPAAAQPYSTVPYFWSDWYGTRIQFVGHPDCDEVLIVDDDGDRLTALYRSGDELTGVLTLNRPGDIMKYRALITRHASWPDALDFAEIRRRATAAAS
ncbi:NAD(P)/FAD-dependent oxidoreductase [Nocardia inohanensis]|uniref:NAD(P)/FAD-dependent oxidoreductase n=1 Tax=Nocardia inohanensis TaxID=209246 RepID=UPI00082F637F|nr:FAD-dependent oxidoreductase [Nocardia inohanensis]